MSNTRCEIFNMLLIPMALAIVLSLSVINVAFELSLLYILCTITTIAHVHYGTCVVSMTIKY